MDYFTRRGPIYGAVDDAADMGFEEYFEKRYAPLSNLPTPPLSSAVSTPMDDDVKTGKAEVMAPADFLSNLVPQSACRVRPSCTLIATYIARSGLPPPTVALAACILDSLSSFFGRNWRRELSLLPQSSRASLPSTPIPIPVDSFPSSSSSSTTNTTPRRMYSSRFSFPSAASWGAPSAISKPEIIVLAALQIASSFLDDLRSEARWWARNIARGAVSTKELDATIRCILQDIDYDLLAFTPEVVGNMRDVMMRATEHEDDEDEDEDEYNEEEIEDQSRRAYHLAISSGLGIITPDPSPV